MTRFARAKGSKGANEKTAEDATPWHIMKQQAAELRASSERSRQLPTDDKNWKEELSKEELITCNSNPVWSEFNSEKPSTRKGKNNPIGNKTSFQSTSDDEQPPKERGKKGERRKKQAHAEENNVTEVLFKGEDSRAPHNKEETEALDSFQEPSDCRQKSSLKKRKRQGSSLSEFSNSDNYKQGAVNLEPEVEETDTNGNIQPNYDEDGSEILEQNKHKRARLQKSKKNKFRGDNNTEYHIIQPSADEEHQRGKGKKNFSHERIIKKGGFGKEKDFKRRKPIVESKVLDINGRKVEVTMFDRFMVKKEDADRLKDLGRKLKEKGVPPEEIQRTLKLERRRAEKALAKEKKRVCFQCRQSGHDLAVCPFNFNSNRGGTGTEGGIQSRNDATSSGPICYKCGSTEHKAFQCRVKQGNDSFGFATCFICKEEGHISRQCPDNPRGLYPRGGACRLCGDVTHLKKDCPTAVAEKETSKVTLGTIDAQTPLEALDNETNTRSNSNSAMISNKRVNKIVKF